MKDKHSWWQKAEKNWLENKDHKLLSPNFGVYTQRHCPLTIPNVSVGRHGSLLHPTPTFPVRLPNVVSVATYSDNRLRWQSGVFWYCGSFFNTGAAPQPRFLRPPKGKDLVHTKRTLRFSFLSLSRRTSLLLNPFFFFCLSISQSDEEQKITRFKTG